MTIQQLITMAERRIAYLTQAKTAAEAVGDVDAITRIDGDIAETQATHNALSALLAG